MPTKRSKKTNRNHFGSVRQLPSGRWQCRYPDPDGRAMTGPTTYPTADEAWGHIAEVKAARRRNTYVDHRKGERILADYARQWIANGGSRGKLTATTEALYTDLLERHIAPATIGTMPIGKVDVAMVKTWHRELGRELAKRAAAPRHDANDTRPRVGTGEARQAQCYRLLKSIMRSAVDEGLLAVSPVRIPGAATVERKPRPVLGLAELAALVAAHPADLRALVSVTFGASLRLGEVVGLARGDYDAKAGTIKVRGQVVQINGTGEVFTPTKTKKVRSVHLPASTRADLDAYLRRVPKALPSAPLWVREDGRAVTRSQTIHAFKRARRVAELEQFSIHDLRRGSLTLAAIAGATIRELMDRAGHSTAQAAMIYQGVAQERAAEVAGRMDDLMQGAVG